MFFFSFFSLVELNAVLQESTLDLDGVQSSLFTLKMQLNKAEELINALKVRIRGERCNVTMQN